jgi:hypothetical protein
MTTLLHELGHAVGLSHAFPAGDPEYKEALNNRKYSVTHMIGRIHRPT